MKTSNALVKTSKAKEALEKASTFGEVVKIRRTAKAVAEAVRDKFNKEDVKKGLDSALDARDKALEAEALQVFAEYKAGNMLRELPEDYTLTDVCRDAEINSNIANEWKRFSEKAFKKIKPEQAQTFLEEYVTEVQNDLIGLKSVTLRGFWEYVHARTSGESVDGAYRSGKKQEFSLMLLSNGDEEALQDYVNSASKRVSKIKTENLLKAQKGILENGYIPRN